MATIITDEATDVDARIDDGRMLVSPDDLTAAIGWELKPEGLCRDDLCVAVRDPASLLVDDDIDVGAVAGVLQRPFVLDAGAAIGAMALPSEGRRRALADQQAPSFTLHDLDGNSHSLDEWGDRKKLLMAFSSW